MSNEPTKAILHLPDAIFRQAETSFTKAMHEHRDGYIVVYDKKLNIFLNMPDHMKVVEPLVAYPINYPLTQIFKDVYVYTFASGYAEFLFSLLFPQTQHYN